ncbi:MAG: aldose 1-epimerase [Burkholderiaceae bacterium]
MNPAHEVVWLEHQSSTANQKQTQRLGLVPAMGGSVAAWTLDRTGFQFFDLFRPWDGADHAGDPLRIVRASYPLAPWSNRISGGGFSVGEKFHHVTPNAAGMPYPIHGDAWQQPWQVTQQDAASLEMTLESSQCNGNPHHYRAVQSFKLVDGGMNQTLTVTHMGDTALPYGLGLHPWLPRNELTTLQAKVSGAWLSHADCLPKEHTTDFPPSWDLNAGISAAGNLIDNCFTGWDGTARVTWPDQVLQLTLSQSSVNTEVSTHLASPNYLLVFRKATGDHFCLEPVSHPIDAFHQAGQPGLQVLEKGESLSFGVSWRFKTTQK